MAKENTLIYRAQTRDEGAFADLMRAYHAFVYTIVVGIVDNPHDAEEVVQDAFLNAYQGLSQLEDATKFKSWLAEITRNRARNWLRKQRGETVSLDDVSEQMLQTEDSPDEQLARLEQRELIRRTMETLPQKDRDIARAFYLEGASYDELISTHGLSYNAIALRLFRIKRKLSKQLRYLLTGIFVSPTMTLKKLYMGGLTVMKVGTVPKVTIGAAGLIAIIFIGFIGVRQIRAPQVEERVYLSPWEDGAARPRNNAEGLAAQTNSTENIEVRDNQPQIASAASAEKRELIDDLFAELDEADLAQFAAEVNFDPDEEENRTTDTSASSESTSRSAEDVMYAYVEAWRNSDFKAMRPLLTTDMRRSSHDHDAEGSIEIGKVRNEGSDDIPDEVIKAMAVEKIKQLKPLLDVSFREMQSQASAINGEYVGDEFHFRLRMPAPKILDSREQGVEMSFTTPPDTLIKMRREEGVWRVYDGLMLE
ncbi:sigma-70 family RNA polymerase sigma factor [Candidatus Poribacteria bacterium]|nr:sigma-70 family RNA polymerase sigma factor [Candidatus Poribacteria bacterium]